MSCKGCPDFDQLIEMVEQGERPEAIVERYIGMVAEPVLGLSRPKHEIAGPKGVQKYYDNCMDRYHDQEYCARVAWNIYCSHVNPGHEGCTEFGKTWGPPYSKPLSK